MRRLLVLITLTAFALVGCQSSQPPGNSVNENRPEAYSSEQGELRTVTVGDIELTYELIDGLAIYQGDIILGTPEQVIELLQEANSSSAQGVGLDSSSRRWSTGVVPYVIDLDSYPAADRSAIQSLVSQAREHLVEHTNIRLRQRSGEADYLVIRDPSDPNVCGSSYLGRMGGDQELYMAADCSMGVLVHELLHALGELHEQARSDRDSFVTINRANIMDGYESNFDKCSTSLCDDFGAYDYDSIMHYGPFAFSRNSKPTISTIPPGRPIGNRSGLSDGDKSAICTGLYPLVTPGVVVSSPTDGATFTVGDEVVLDGNITDADGVERTTSARWVSSRDGVLRTASYPRAAIPLSNLSPGEHTITLETVTDCTNSSDSVVITVEGEASMEIVSPGDGASYPRGRVAVSFRTETVGFPTPPSVSWESSIDGPIGESTGELSKIDLSFGTHTITASVADPAGGTISDTVTITITNDPPTVEILEPSDTGPTFCVGESITFQASSVDLNNPPSYDLPPENISWSISGGAAMGSGSPLDYTFDTAGDYTVIARATDDQGAFDEASVSVAVENCSDSPPTVTITVPEADTEEDDTDFAYDGFDDSRGQWYKDVNLQGTASDPEDGTLTGASLAWMTNRTELQSASLGTGTAITARLYSDTCTGTWHEITLSATDSDGNVRSDLRRIFIWTLC